MSTLLKDDLKLWDISSVTDMSSMFSQCTTFNQNLTPWIIKAPISKECLRYEKICKIFNLLENKL